MKYFLQITTPNDVEENIFDVLHNTVNMTEGYQVKVTEITSGHKYRFSGTHGRFYYLFKIDGFYRMNRIDRSKIYDVIKCHGLFVNLHPHADCKYTKQHEPCPGDWGVFECHNIPRLNMLDHKSFKGQGSLENSLKMVYFSEDIYEAINFIRIKVNQFDKSKWINCGDFGFKCCETGNELLTPLGFTVAALNFPFDKPDRNGRFISERVIAEYFAHHREKVQDLKDSLQGKVKPISLKSLDKAFPEAPLTGIRPSRIELPITAKALLSGEVIHKSKPWIVPTGEDPML